MIGDLSPLDLPEATLRMQGVNAQINMHGRSNHNQIKFFRSPGAMFKRTLSSTASCQCFQGKGESESLGLHTCSPQFTAQGLSDIHYHEQPCR